jgi:hypothetical protein
VLLSYLLLLLLVVLLLSGATGSARCWLWMYLRYCQAIFSPSSGAAMLLPAAVVLVLLLLVVACWTASCSRIATVSL